ncbi:hypothetical protein ACJQWK_01895 [Exserohilum turcicum]
MNRPTTANGQYQTYANPMPSAKRKQITPLNHSDLSGYYDHPSFCSKKARYDKDSYNPKYMADMCFNQHKSCLPTLDIAGYPHHVEQDYRQDLLVMFTHARSKGYFRPDTAARHMIPRLAGLAPRTRADKMALVHDFISHYNSVRCDVLFIQDLMSGDSQFDLDFVTTTRTCIATLHMTLAKGTKWRTIMPYTPLPTACLSVLTGFVQHPKHCELLSDLTDSVQDIKSWLSIPSPCIEFSATLIDSAVDTLAQQTGKTNHEEAENSIIVPENEKTAELKTLKEQVRLLEAARRQGIEQAQAERVQLNRHIEALEVASAEKSAKHSAGEESWVATVAELERQHCKQSEQQLRDTERLTAALAAE